MLACFAGSGSAELRVILGAIGILWVVAGMAALVNVGLMAALKRRDRAILSDGVAFAIYATAGGMVVSQWVFVAAPMLGVFFVAAVPLAVLAHLAALFWRLRQSSVAYNCHDAGIKNSSCPVRQFSTK